MTLHLHAPPRAHARRIAILQNSDVSNKINIDRL